MAGALYIEGAQAFVELSTLDGVLVAAADTPRYVDELELLEESLPPGEYLLVSYVRPCEGACPRMDPPTDQCQAQFFTQPGAATVLTIRRTVGRPCTIEVRQVTSQGRGGSSSS